MTPNRHHDPDISAILAGDRSAEERLCRRHVKYLTRAIYAEAKKRGIGADLGPTALDDAVRDATTDALIWGIRSAHKYDYKRGAVRTWLVEKARSELRKRARREETYYARLRQAQLQLIAEPVLSPEQNVARSDLVCAINSVLARLSEEQSTALLLVDYYGFPLARVARELRISDEAASSLVRRARKSFKRWWTKATLERGGLGGGEATALKQGASARHPRAANRSR